MNVMFNSFILGSVEKGGTQNKRELNLKNGKFFVKVREKGRDLTQSCDKNPYTHRTIQKAT